MIQKFSVKAREPAGPSHLGRKLGDLLMWKDYYFEFTDELTPEQCSALCRALGDPLVEVVVPSIPLDPATQVQVAYKRGIVDNENDSLVALADMLGIHAVAAKVAITYTSSHSELSTVVEAEACNPNIEEMHTSEPHYNSLLPVGSWEPMETFDLRLLDDAALAALGTANGRSLEADKMRLIRDIQIDQGLDCVTDVILEALDARWSDHCAHTTWKSLGNLLGRLVRSSEAAANPNTISMFHDNAGIWDFYDGYAIAIKGETHNGPSGISAYFGQLTKLGGVLRDILGTGLGADPIGSFEYTATGLPHSPAAIDGRPTPKKIAQETIRAVKEYGNTFGVPMMWSHMTFHEGYRAKPFALGGSIGLIPREYAQRGRAQPGDMVMLLGGLTGNDGIHGASASSAGAAMDTSAVQIGSPLEEVKFREAIIDLRDAGCIRAITDLGAAGINSAVGEMGEGVGVWINTALVPLKSASLPMWRILLSESQERMLLAIAPEQLGRARELLSRHEVRNTVIGRFTGTDRYCVAYDEDVSEKHIVELDITQLPDTREVGMDLPYSSLGYRPPQREVDPPHQPYVVASQWPSMQPADLARVVGNLVCDGELYDQSYASSQYDSSVQGTNYYGPVIGEEFSVPTGYYASKPVLGHPGAIVFNTSFNPWLYEAHPVYAARQSFLSILTGQVLAGSKVTDVCLCDNFYTPHLAPHSEGWLVAMVNELAELAEQFRTPFISGKDSSAGSTHTDEGIVSVPPGVFLSALGKVPDARCLRTEQWTRTGNLLVRVGPTTPSLAGTAAARVLDREANDVDELSPQAVYTFLDELSSLPLSVAPSGRPIGTGGVVGAAILGALASGMSAELDVPPGGCEQLLQEHRVAALIEVPEQSLAELSPQLGPLVVGRLVAGGPGVTVGGVQLLEPSVVDSWQSTFEEELS